jgi:uncharacterized protein YndB with AHSA1/START domain
LHGNYREISPPEHLVLTHQWEEPNAPETLVSVRFLEENGRTRVTLHQRGFTSRTERDSHADGWRSTFDRFAEYLEHDTDAR